MKTLNQQTVIFAYFSSKQFANVPESPFTKSSQDSAKRTKRLAQDAKACLDEVIQTIEANLGDETMIDEIGNEIAEINHTDMSSLGLEVNSLLQTSSTYTHSHSPLMSPLESPLMSPLQSPLMSPLQSSTRCSSRSSFSMSSIPD